MTSGDTIEVALEGPLDVPGTLSGLVLQHGDPTLVFDADAVWRATHTEQGPATVRYVQHGRGARVTAWGPGASAALGAAPDLLGARNDPGAFRTGHPVVGPLATRHPGVRIGRSGKVMERLVAVVIAQKVTGKGASKSFRELVARYGSPAPGPGPVRLPPRPEQLAELSYYHLHELGIERRRAEVLIAACARARRLEQAVGMAPEAAMARLQALPGIGPWTAGHVLAVAQGDPDRLPLGDYNLPHLVAWALAGEERGDDARMLELLEPFRPHRGRVVRLLKLSGVHAPRKGPRLPVRDIRGS